VANKNTKYEILVAQIHQAMLDYDGFENLRVEHNVTLTGKSGSTHQIDVYWEFIAAGLTYRTCIECKNYSSSVKKSHVAAFSEILRDIGNVNGVIATTVSFQKGAKLLANHNNIRLVLVNYMLKDIHITSRPKSIKYENLKIIFNKNNIKEKLRKKGLKKYSLSYCIDGNTPLFDSKNEPVETFNSLFGKRETNKGRNFIQDINLFMDTNEMGKLLIESIYVDISHTHLPEMKNIIHFPNVAKAVIEDIVKNNIFYLHDDGCLSDKPTSLETKS